MDSSLANARNLSRKSLGKRKIDERNVGNKKDDVRGYFTWNLDMERVLAEALRDQRSLGRQSDGAWKTVAYNAAADVLSTRFNVLVTGENVKNRIKLWRGWYGIISDILSQSGFDWDGTKCMINVEDENAWTEYVKSHEEAKRFRFKVIPNWNDIVDICAKDRANGVQVEHAFDADDVMSKEVVEDEEGSTVHIDLEEPSSATKKKMQHTRAYKGRDKEGMISSIREVAESLKDFVQVSKKRMEGNAQEVVQEVLNEMEMIADCDDALRYGAINWLTENPNKIAILKALPLWEKKKFLLASMPK
ncbi:uncharacterized protein LOC131611885 isoform X2 [Vicia villosa]|uniref:uncharacterized protein LOC131598667 isoform X2 n=1 Tax=Vicia villosa TaxID=3911 RepID=UPI00273CCC86|nr:uncharacterized protein LOC131598667 isoform X2 [Vicia villosa]XP_058727234.1 uncharacterized protein LOC131598667 isoform X2 [Vicia villosa]XP_058739702.1 uncharacterized protein LOC131611885 isoform X2 [Vicia villosa]XP_058739703.1 uncharacterized protein LOC131611885 isoform X2 [Vicia villosa]